MTASNTAIARTEEKIASIPGTYRGPQEITKRLQFAAANFHLVSPSTACGVLPEGFAVSFATVLVDVERETYPVAGGGDEDGGSGGAPRGKRGLSKVALDRISHAAGVSWTDSRRLDDRSDANYCEWEAVGQVRTLDGQLLVIRAQKVMDLREGSPAVDALWSRFENKKKRYPNAKSPDGQIREMRLHIASHAETKARLRAVRSLGIRTSYDASELAKPFVVSRSTWTGQSSDPVLQRQFAVMTAEAMLGGSRALYGKEPARPAPAIAPRPVLAVAPPPVGTVTEPIDDEEPPAKSEPRELDEPPPAAA